MQKIVRKPYYDFEREEKWLNKMSADGWSLIEYSWCKYTFEKAEPNEYVYRIELLEHSPKDKRSKEYIDFLKDTDIECVSSYFRWIYLRKKSSQGAFDLFSDLQSKIRHFKRVCKFFGFFAVIEFCALLGVMNSILRLNNVSNLDIGDYLMVAVASSAFLLLLIIFTKSFLRLNVLKKEKKFRE